MWVDGEAWGGFASSGCELGVAFFDGSNPVAFDEALDGCPHFVDGLEEASVGSHDVSSGEGVEVVFDEEVGDGEGGCVGLVGSPAFFEGFEVGDVVVGDLDGLGDAGGVDVGLGCVGVPGELEEGCDADGGGSEFACPFCFGGEFFVFAELVFELLIPLGEDVGGLAFELECGGVGVELVGEVDDGVVVGGLDGWVGLGGAVAVSVADV